MCKNTIKFFLAFLSLPWQVYPDGVFKKKKKFILMVVPRLNSWPQAWTNGSNIMNTTNMQQTITHNFSPTTGSLTITAVTMTLWVEENEGEFSWTVFSVFSWSPVLIYLRSKIAYYLDRISIYSVMYEFDFVCMYSFVRPRWKLNSNCILTLMFSKRYAYFFCSYGHEDWFVCLFLLMYH